MKKFSAFWSRDTARSLLKHAARRLSRRRVLCLVFSAVLASGNAMAFEAEEGFGVGFVLGIPSGISASLPLGEKNAINGIAGYALNRGANFNLLADYVWIENDVLPVESGRVGFYYGPGAFTEISRETTAGIHVVAGVDYRFQETPLQIFLQIAPGINVIPDTKIALSGGWGLRYYF
jgi:hypothetical protein